MERPLQYEAKRAPADLSAVPLSMPSIGTRTGLYREIKVKRDSLPVQGNNSSRGYSVVNNQSSHSPIIEIGTETSFQRLLVTHTIKVLLRFQE